MNEFKVKCTGVTQNMTSRVKRDANGEAVKNDKGITVWEPCPRWSFTFTICGVAPELHGSFNLQTTKPEVAARYQLDGTYMLAVVAV